MQLRYRCPDGKETIKRLGSEPVIIGRALEADVSIEDEKASRCHCEIRLWDGDYAIKDLKSRNGTFVNGKAVDIAQLHSGDRITVGDMLFFFEEKAPLGTTTAVREMEDKMSEGKGYRTILREIVQDIGKDPEPQEAPHEG